MYLLAGLLTEKKGCWTTGEAADCLSSFRMLTGLEIRATVGVIMSARSIAAVPERLAIDGGTPVRVAPPPPWPDYAPDEIAAVVETLRSGKVNQWTGKQVRLFERTFGDLHEMPFAVALANGSLALEAILRACGIGPGDEVIVTPRSFIASASCVNLVGAKPIFADIDIDSEAIAPSTVRPLITDRTKAIIVVHLNGRPADMPGFMELAKQHDILVFEDCAQAHGARINGKLVGSFGHASAFSFCQDKIISTGGEGGMALFRDESHWRRAWSYRDHGKDNELVFERSSPPGFRWVHTSLGSNWRLTELQAVIGLHQLSKLPTWTTARTANARELTQWLTPYPSVHVATLPPNHQHAFYRFSFRLVPKRLKSDWNRNRVMRALIAEGIPSLSGACPEIYLEGAYAKSMAGFQRLPNAAYLGTVSLGLLVHPTLDGRFLGDCRVALEKVFDAATN
jgi:dTDP-4-amino-4,6-dideoxygalactose transaminase